MVPLDTGSAIFFVAFSVVAIGGLIAVLWLMFRWR
jgi:hypothetical protein